MRDWNVVVTVRERGFARAFEILGQFGEVGKTEYYNVLVMRVEDVRDMIGRLEVLESEHPHALSFLTRIAPVTHPFQFQSPEEFREKARGIVLPWVPELGGKSFHVRMRRRGFKGRLSSLEEEKFLDTVLLEALERTGAPGRITFDDPDVIVAVDTVGTRGGLSRWTRDELKSFPHLRPD
jgi:tRNA(Ser,Leu) C12 N-acetylase TAN1